MRKTCANQSGFTLVELVITVMIIGILSVIGLPTFSRMHQKSRIVEAQVALGTLATTESAFYSEFGAFGNSLANMGLDYTSYNGAVFASVISDTSRRYAYGFPQANCSGSPVPQPPPAGNFGAVINQQMPAYYSNFPCITPPNPSDPSFCPQPSMLGRTSLTLCGTAGSPAALLYSDVYGAGGGSANHYVAVASGVIAPGIDLDNPTSLSQLDIWTIDEGHALANVQSGIK